MAKVYLFNPDNEMALASGARNYTPPRAVAAFCRAGALLPAYWAVDGDFILAPEEYEPALRRINPSLRIFRAENGDEITGAEPWGWSLAARERFLRGGVPACLLPDDKSLEEIKRLSSRETAAKVNRRLRELSPGRRSPGPALVSSSEREVMDYIARREGRVFVKSPWSSSGRGVFPASGMDRKNVEQIVAGIIQRQGMVTVEDSLDKLHDFASLFFSDGRTVRFMGWSVFETHGRGAYLGNVVAPQRELRRCVLEYGADEEVIPLLEEALTAEISGGYRGWLGVDMMTYRDGDSVAVAPCIEINLRRTMGVVAMDLAERFDTTTPRLFRVEATRSSAPVEGNLLPGSERDGFCFRISSE